MGSVIDYVDCPNCGNEAADDYYYKTGEEYINCCYCGYHKSISIKDRTKRISELTDDDYLVVEINNPLGSYRIKYKAAIGYEVGSIRNDEHLKFIKDTINEYLDSIEEASYNKLEDGEIKTVNLLS